MTRLLQKWTAIAALLLLMLTGATPWLQLPRAYAADSGELVLGMDKLGDANGYILKTVRTERDYPFTKPQGWAVKGSSKIVVTLQHSPDLLPERSSLNVLVNGRILETIRLSPDNVKPTTVEIPIPPGILKDHNTLSFQVDQHYTYKCEDPFSAELWTTVMPDTKMILDYDLVPAKPDLAALPYPLIDPLNTYKTAQIGYIAPQGISDKSLEALAVTSLFLGQQASWRSMMPFYGDPADLSQEENFVVVGTPAENPAISALGGTRDVNLSGDKFVDDNGAPLPDGDGVIQLVPNPYHPENVVLVVSGNSPQGVANAAHLLAQKPADKVLVGRSAIVKEFNSDEPHPYRAWDGFVQYSGASFQDLGLDTMTTRGITGLPLYYQIKMMPDLFLSGNQRAKFHIVYSYASQLDATQSKLEVLMDDKAIRSIPLDDPSGKSLASFDFEIPAGEMKTYNNLQFRFHLYPTKYDMCRFVTDEHIWGTIHNVSRVDTPAEIKTALPDVGLLNDGAFPFAVYQDFSDVAVVMPDKPEASDYDLMLQALSRMGRVSQSKRGIRLVAYHAGTLPDGVRNQDHLIVVGAFSRNSLFEKFQSKLRLIVDGKLQSLKGANDKIAEINHTPDQGLMEELLSPWNGRRVVLQLTGETDTALKRVGQAFKWDDWFASINPGNVAVVNADGVKSLIMLEHGEAKFYFSPDLKEGFNLPAWVWIMVCFFAIVGFFSILRFLFGR